MKKALKYTILAVSIMTLITLFIDLKITCKTTKQVTYK